MSASGSFPYWNSLAEWLENFWNAACPALVLITVGVLIASPAKGVKRSTSSHSAPHYASLPLVFEQNCGQADPAVKFLARGTGYAIFLTEKETVISLERSTANSLKPFSESEVPGRHTLYHNPLKDVLLLQWTGSNPKPRVEGLDKQTDKSNYLIGNDPAKWIRRVPTYSKVIYRKLYPGVGVIYYGNHRQLEFDIRMAPGVKPDSVRLKIEGASHGAANLRVNRRGELVAHTRAGDVHFRRPRAYQPSGNSGNERHFLPARYVLEKDGQVGFEVHGYDPAMPLTIDPVLSYSTYLGGSDYNYATGIAVDASGNTYVTGYTSSIDFPVSGGVQDLFSGGSCDTEDNAAPCFDAFVAKLNPQGSGLVYATYLGGTGDDRGVGITVDAAGEVSIAGFTNSVNFPTAGPLQGANGGGSCGTTTYPEPCYDAFIAKLGPSGSNLVYSTYLGGTGDDFASRIVTDSGGNAYVSGLTSASNFPVTAGALQTGYGGGPFDGFVAKVNSSGTSLVYSTYLGGSQEDHVNDIVLDSSGDAYLTGQTNSSNFPVKGGFQPNYTAATCGSTLSNFPCFESFVATLNAAGSGLVYSTYLGGTAATYGSGIALDSSGAAYVTGWTTSSDFPVTDGAYDTKWGGSDEAFVAKITPSGDAIGYATYLGSINPDQSNAIAVDSGGHAYIAGYAYGGQFPVTAPLQYGSGGLYDAFVTELNTTGSALLFSTYLGGAGDEAANDLALDSSGNVYVAGDTFSADFPVTPAARTTGYTGGSYDAWIAKISPQNAAGLTAVPNPLAFASQEVNTTSAPLTLKLSDAGSEALNISELSVTGDFAKTSQCGETVAPGTQCAITVTFTPTAVGVRAGTLVIKDNAAGSPHTVKLSGDATSGAVSLSSTGLSFGPVAVGTTSTQTLTLTNVAQSPLDISGIQAGGDYTEKNTCGNILNPAASCSITVSFSPDSLGTIVGTVTITDTALGSPQTITLTGTGTTPPAASVSPSNLSFGSQAVGTTSLPQTVTLTNTGGAPMMISSIVTTADFFQANKCGQSLASGASCTVSVTFTPHQTGSETGVLTITDNAAGSPQTVNLSGSGDISFTLAAKQSSVTVLEGSGQAQFSLSASTNDGFTGSIVLGCANIAPATCAFDPASVAPGQSSTLTVGNLNAVTSPSFDFTVTGTVATPTQLSSISTSVTSSSSDATSPGTVMATLTLSVQFADFSLAASPADNSIPAGETANYTLTLTPVNGFNMPVSLACSGTPAGSTCSLSPSTAEVGPSAPAQVTLAVHTTSRSLVYPLPDAGRSPWSGPRLLRLGLWLWVGCFWFGFMLLEVRRWTLSPGQIIRNVGVILLIVLMLVSCGGGGGGSAPPAQNSGTPAGTYTITVTATAQSLSHTSEVTLRVN